MRQIISVVLAACLPVAALAQDAVIRIEAKRGEASAQKAATGWREQFDNVVTFPLSGKWIGIALGPLPREEADALHAELRGAGRIPSDSFVAVPASDVALTPVRSEAAVTGGTRAGTEATEDADRVEAVPDAASDAEPEVLPVPGSDVMAVPAGDQATTAPVEREEEPEAGPDTFIRLQSLKTEAEAKQALTTWRKEFPGAGIWQLPGGWFAVALGPFEKETAQAWLGAFRQGGALPKDAFTSDLSEMGKVVVPGEAPDLPAPGEAAEMPPVVEMQRALRWAGHYDGEIDGKSGPGTRAAIQAEILGERLSPDPATAMHKLIERRENWRKEMGLTILEDDHTGLSLNAPMDKLKFDRTERALSIYGPEQDSGGALILFSQPGGQQELLDLSGLITALGWVPQPKRQVENGHVLLTGENSDHRGRAEGWVRDGRAEGFVLIWPSSDARTHERLAAEMSDSLTRTETETTPETGQAETGPEITPIQQ